MRPISTHILRVVLVVCVAVVATPLLALSPHMLASGSRDAKIRVWHWPSGRLYRTLVGHQDQVLALKTVATSRLASGSADKTIRLWNVNNGECLHVLVGHTASVLTLALLEAQLSGETVLISGSHDRTIKVWSPHDATCIYTLTGHTAGVLSLVVQLPLDAFSSLSADGTIRRWNASTFECERVGFVGAKESLSTMRELASNKRRLVTGSTDGRVSVWDESLFSLATSKPERQNDGPILSLETLPNGQVVSGDWHGNVNVWNVLKRTSTHLGVECVASLGGHRREVSALQLMSDTRMASASEDGTIAIWDLQTYELVRMLTEHAGGITSLENV